MLSKKLCMLHFMSTLFDHKIMIFWFLFLMHAFHEILCENIKIMKMNKLIQTMKDQALKKNMQLSAEKMR